MHTILQNGLLLLVVLDISITVFLLHEVAHLVTSFGVAVMLFKLAHLLRNLFGGVSDEPLTMDIAWRKLLLSVPTMLSHLLIKLLLVMLLLVHVVVCADNWVVVVTTPILLLRDALDFMAFMLLALFIVLLVVASDDIELPVVIIEVLEFSLDWKPKLAVVEVEIR